MCTNDLMKKPQHIPSVFVGSSNSMNKRNRLSPQASSPNCKGHVSWVHRLLAPSPKRAPRPIRRRLPMLLVCWTWGTGLTSGDPQIFAVASNWTEAVCCLRKEPLVHSDEHRHTLGHVETWGRLGLTYYLFFDHLFGPLLLFQNLARLLDISASKSAGKKPTSESPKALNAIRGSVGTSLPTWLLWTIPRGSTNVENWRVLMVVSNRREACRFSVDETGVSVHVYTFWTTR